MPGGAELRVYHLSTTTQDNAIREIDIPADAEEFTHDVQLAPLPVARLVFVDPDGNELPGVKTQGLAPINPFADGWSNTWQAPLPTARTELVGPEVGETRRTLFLNPAGDLGAMLSFKAEDTRGDMEHRIVLRPCGIVKGRIVDGRGQPVAGARIGAEVAPSDNPLPPGNNAPSAAGGDRNAWRLMLNLVQASADGRFEMKGIPPGARYAINGFAEKRGEKWSAVTGEIGPGQTLELGDIVPQASRAPAPTPRGSPRTAPP